MRSLYISLLRNLLLVVAVAATTASPAAAADWNQWRGPNRDAVIAVDLPETWPKALRRVWTLDVGGGHASPIVVDGTVFLNSRLNNLETVTAIDLETGAVKWQDGYAASYDMPRAAASHGQGPKSTPLHDGFAVYTLGISGVLSSYEANTGTLRWRNDFIDDFPRPYPVFGTAMSPIAVDGRIVVHVGGTDGGALGAFDPDSGQQVWAWSGDGPSYASPIVAEINGVRHLVTQSEHAFLGIDPETGDLLWTTPYTTPYDQNIVTTVVDGETIVTSGLEQGISAYRPAMKDDAWALEQLWHNSDVALYMSSPVLKDGDLFGFSHHKRGQFFRVDGDTGETVWLSDGRQGENATVVAAGDWLLWLTTGGELTVTRLDADAFEPVARYPVSESPVWAHLVLTDSGFLVKDANTLSLWSVPR